MSSTPPTNMLQRSGQTEVRRQVRALLERTPAFAELGPTQRREIANAMVQVVSYLSDPAAGRDDLVDAAAQNNARSFATGLKKSGLVGEDFVAGAAREGGEAFKTLVSAVDFPQFVSGLIEGVFTSIVNSSIRQMQEYGKFLEAVVKSVQEFADEHVSANEARDYLVGRFPKALQVSVDDDGPRLGLSPNIDDDQLPDFGADLGLESFSFDDENAEQRLVEAARLKMARLRQQQLTTMVLMGINRIVVTDGQINAKVVFDVKTEDTASRSAQRTFAADYDQESESSSKSFWGTSRSKVNTTVSTSFNSDQQQKSQSEIETRAKLTGEVRVNFKSETFPLEKMATPEQLSAVQGQQA